ncbi:hypothetical protein JTE90_011774 [Oedothorax gibbosus]|uniref:Uncharacterized protein n=1 Tax=Oedothorax gibbosus TaxID=931172 RepID=A0AAV6VU63_9ARAC|nr:hypothetical protein JTE90_011774 [Oedothorax gibbosus]
MGCDGQSNLQGGCSCSSLETLHWDGKSKLQYFQAYLKGAQVSYWLTTYAFLIHFVMTLLRWYTNVDMVLAEERELRENPNFHDIVLQDLEEDEDTLRSVSLYAKQK